MGNSVSDDKKRESGPDLVRSIACFFVVGAHFYLNMGYYNVPLDGAKMFVETAFRWLFVTAVPLFFMLTGYFKKNKKADRSHYMALVPLAISYVVISVAKIVHQSRELPDCVVYGTVSVCFFTDPVSQQSMVRT